MHRRPYLKGDLIHKVLDGGKDEAHNNCKRFDCASSDCLHSTSYPPSTAHSNRATTDSDRTCSHTHGRAASALGGRPVLSR